MVFAFFDLFFDELHRIVGVGVDERMVSLYSNLAELFDGLTHGAKLSREE